ncbi:glycosyltransferase [Pseudomonas sp. Marseille-Q5115]|uniref:glycosyltransferase family protein n=1 Tax=Pseudomonas sp. Marseille-Q5115 TaxID=2866593 RepID=UPI001CE4048D|nr:glycosyltransferase [Pseudomonas sp. Marseille-Q5115]
MNVLFLVQKDQRAILDELYQGVAAHCTCDLRWLDSADQRNLRAWFKRNVDVTRYDRILFFLRFKQEIRQVSFIRTVPNLVILEHDAYQNYITCKYTGKFSEHYRHLPWVRVISSGAQVTRRLREEGVDAHFVPKGYDHTLVGELGLVRDIELGFVGSLKSVAYAQRKAFLESLAAVEDLLITRTESGAEYNHMLNRIRFFVSADVGMGEYMIKNFEAMAAGCVLFAYDQGEEENAALGFTDMGNVVLYRDLAQLREKLSILREQPAFAARIAAQGQALVQGRYGFNSIGAQVVECMRAPLRPTPVPGRLARLRNALGI